MFGREGDARGDALQVVRQQVLAEVPGRRLRRPGHARALVGAEQHALALLAHVDLGLEVDDVLELGLSLQLRQVLGDEVLVLHGEDRKLEPDEAADFARPQSARVHDVLGVDRAVLGDDVPGAVRPLLRVDDAVLAHDLGAADLGGFRVGVRDAVRIHVPFDRVVDRAEEMLLLEQRMELLGLRRRDQLEVHAEVAAARHGHPQPVDALRRPGQEQAAAHVNAAGDAGDRLDLLVQVDRVLLQAGDVRVAVQRCACRPRHARSSRTSVPPARSAARRAIPPSSGDTGRSRRPRRRRSPQPVRDFASSDFR